MSGIDPPKTETKNELAREREENARKSQETAERLFPRHEWEKVEDGIYLSTNRPVGDKSGYPRELENAQILRNLGSTVYLTPEPRNVKGKKYDAIVNGLVYEFKNVKGNANTLEHQFLRSRSQAPNVFINLDESPLMQRDVMSALYGARNKRTHVNREGKTVKGYDDSNQFPGGQIILKLKGTEGLIYMDVDDLKIPKG